MADPIRVAIVGECGPQHARLDQEVTLAMAESARRGGEPINLPLVDRDQRLPPGAMLERLDRAASLPGRRAR